MRFIKKEKTGEKVLLVVVVLGGERQTEGEKRPVSVLPQSFEGRSSEEVERTKTKC